MLFPLLLIWIQLLQKDDLFLGVLFTLLFKQVVVHFSGFSSPPFSHFTIETGHSSREILDCEVLSFNFKTMFHIKFLTFFVHMK